MQGIILIATNLFINIIWFFLMTNRIGAILTIVFYFLLRLWSIANSVRLSIGRKIIPGKINKAYIYIILLVITNLADFGLSSVINHYRSPHTVRIRGNSMEPLIEDADLIMVDQAYYDHNPIKRGDLVNVITEDGATLYIKRIIALPGEMILIKDGKIYIDDKKFGDKWGWYNKDIDIYDAIREKLMNYPEEKLGKNMYFIMGDNRFDSFDSRFLGPIERKNVKEKALYRMLPLNKSSALY